MRQVPLERDYNIAMNGPFWVEVANPEHPLTAMLISRFRGNCLIEFVEAKSAACRILLAHWPIAVSFNSYQAIK